MERRSLRELLRKSKRIRPLLKLISAGDGFVLLEAKNLTVYYGAVKALEGVSFHVAEGEIVAMIGPNGAGKSTALKAVCGLVKPRSGEVLFQSEKINGLRPDELVSKGLSLVPEGRRIFPTMTVLENLEMGAFTRNDPQAISEDIGKVFNLFPVLKERQRQKAGTLSTGEQQMLALGRALMLKPKLLLADEPSLGLSPNFVDLIFEKLIEINKNGTSILLVEQNARMALEIAHRAYVFNIGAIALEDNAKNLFENEEVKKAFLAG
jgi:branched-chain amino acid transport system ATP-binding protein